MRGSLKLLFALAVVVSGSLAIKQTLRSRDPGPPKTWTVFVCSPDGEVQVVSRRPGEYGLPCIHPDGQSVVFQGRAPGERNRIWSADIETGEMRPLTPDANAWMPVYSRDGSRIAFTSDLNSEEQPAWSLWRFPLDESPPEQITLAGVETAFHGSQALNGRLAFDSPRGTDG